MLLVLLQPDLLAFALDMRWAMTLEKEGMWTPGLFPERRDPDLGKAMALEQVIPRAMGLYPQMEPDLKWAMSIDMEEMPPLDLEDLRFELQWDHMLLSASHDGCGTWNLKRW